jgi:hypothetical protein
LVPLLPTAMVPLVPSLTPVVPSAVPFMAIRAELVKLLKLNNIKNTKDYLASYQLIQYYFQLTELSNGHLNGSLTTDAANAKASQIWEGQLRLAVKDGALKHFSRTRACSTMAAALKCPQPLTSISARTMFLMCLNLSSCSAMMSKASWSLSKNIAPDLMGSSTTSCVARLGFPRCFLLCYSFGPCMAAILLSWSSSGPVSSP